MKTKYPIGQIDLRHQPDQIELKKAKRFLEYGVIPDKARLFLILSRGREIELFSDGNKLIDVKIILGITNIHI